MAVEGIQQELIAKRHRRERLRKRTTSIERGRQLDVFDIDVVPSKSFVAQIPDSAPPADELSSRIPLFKDLPPVREGEVQKEPMAGARAVLKSFPNRTAIEQVCPHCDGAIPPGSIHKHEVWE